MRNIPINIFQKFDLSYFKNVKILEYWQVTQKLYAHISFEILHISLKFVQAVYCQIGYDLDLIIYTGATTNKLPCMMLP